MQVSFYIATLLGVLGVVMGSFAGAQVWRLRARQLKADKAAGEKVDHREYKHLSPLMSRKQRDDRSMCLQCGHSLRWYDLLPLVSWLSTSGRCRYCKKSIGAYEPLVELGTAALFVVSFIAWPLGLETSIDITAFATWLVLCVLLVILFAYDTKWFLLPDVIMYPAIAVGVVFVLLQVVAGADTAVYVANIAGSIAILSGIYLVLWLISKGAWIGFGDVKLGILLSLIVGQWELALLTLFLANLIGCLIVIPGLLAKKLDRKTQVPFGPMLIMACLISFFFGESIIAGYTTVTMNLLML